MRAIDYNDGRRKKGVHDREGENRRNSFHAASHSAVVDLIDRQIIAEVVAACRSGDRDAVGALYDIYKDRVYSIALYFFHGDALAASDVTQQVFLKLMTSMGQFRGDAEFSTWLYRLVVNACTDAARPVTDAVTLESPTLDSSLPALRTELEAALVAQGLFPKEAEAMVEIWKDSWFEEGMRLIYIVPARAVDASLPLHVDPAPSQTARVFVGRVELITPEITRTVREAMAKGDWSAMEPYGRFLGSILDRIVADNPSMENAAEQVRAKLFTGACR